MADGDVVLSDGEGATDGAAVPVAESAEVEEEIVWVSDYFRP